MHHVSIVRLIVVFGALAAIVIALFAGSLWATRRWLRRHPHANGAKRVITRTGYALYGCQTLLLFTGLSAPQLQPNGPLGALLQAPGALVGYILILLVGFGLAEYLLKRFGYPTTRLRDQRDV